MKTFTKLFVVIVALFAYACATDTTEDIGINLNGSKSEISLSLEGTKVHIDGKVGEEYPLYWSEGDKISVNGVESSEAEINADDASRANFSFATEVNYPLNILYPSGSTVIFPAEQSYAEGTFAEGSVPMCAYVASKGEAITMKHLAALLRFPVKASIEGVTLHKIVITSPSAQLAGEFTVDCQRGAIAEVGEGPHSVTYTANIPLSTSSEQIFYVALPAVEVGNCTVEFIDSNGEKMRAAWSGNSLSSGVVREFKTITYTPNAFYTLVGFGVENDDFLNNESQGCVCDTNGNPLSGVVVSDGINCTHTDDNGFYRLKTDFSAARHIFVTIPAGYRAPKNKEGMPLFYHAITQRERLNHSCVADFVFEPIEGDANRYTVFVGADPQPRAKSSSYDRFAFHSLDICENFYLDLKESREKISGREVYGLMLGDIVHENMSLFPYYTAGIRTTGIQMFNVIGNHDHDYSATTERDGARVFEQYFGPSYYSVNLGKIHLVVLDNLIMKIVDGKVSKSGYSYGLTEEEFLAALEEDFVVEKEGSAIYKPQALHNFSMYIGGEWYSLTAKEGRYNDADPIGVLDVTILSNLVLDKILGIKDLRTSKRIDFVGGIRGLGELQQRVDSGEMKVAFALYPVSMRQLIDIADTGNIMPPKTTWFEPKLRSGVVIHSFE